jgi:hypothetical protein
MKQAKLKQICHHGSGISKLIFFIDSTSNSKKNSHITSPFWSKKKLKFTKWPPKMSRHEILYSQNRMKMDSNPFITIKNGKFGKNVHEITSRLNTKSHVLTVLEAIL